MPSLTVTQPPARVERQESPLTLDSVPQLQLIQLIQLCYLRGEGDVGLRFISFQSVGRHGAVAAWPFLRAPVLDGRAWYREPGPILNTSSPAPTPCGFLAGHRKAQLLPRSFQSISLLPLIFIGLCLKRFVCNYTVCCMPCFIMTNMKYEQKQREARNAMNIS